MEGEISRQIRTRKNEQGNFFLMTGFLNPWPTLLIIAIFPTLTIIYGWLIVYEKGEIECNLSKTAGMAMCFVKRLGTLNDG